MHLWLSGDDIIKQYAVITFLLVLSHCWLRDRKGIRPVKSWVLVCWWRQ